MAVPEASFRESVDLMFDRAAATLDLPPGLADQTKTCRYLGERVVWLVDASFEAVSAGALGLLRVIVRAFSDPGALLLGAHRPEGREPLATEIPIGTAVLLVILAVAAVLFGLSLG